jgi:hypothetical protein
VSEQAGGDHARKDHAYCAVGMITREAWALGTFLTPRLRRTRVRVSGVIINERCIDTR